MNPINARATSSLDSKDTIRGPSREDRNALLPRSWGEYCYSWGYCMYANWSQFWYKKSLAKPQFQTTQSSKSNVVAKNLTEKKGA